MNLRFFFLLALSSLVAGQAADSDTKTLGDLTIEQREVFDSLEFGDFLDDIRPRNGNLTIELLEEVMEMYKRDLDHSSDEHDDHSDHEGHDHGDHENHSDEDEHGHDDHNNEDEHDHDEHDHEEEHDSHDHHEHDHEEHDSHNDEEEHDDHDHEEDPNVLLLTPQLLFEHLGNESTALTNEQFLESTFMITSCLRNDQCVLLRHDHHDEDDDDDDVFVIKLIALLVLFFEAVIGATLPIWMGSFKKYEYYLSIVNCFSGGVIFATGVIHLIPHVIEYENEQDGLDDYHLGLVITVFSFGLVFFIEHVLFDVHDHSEHRDAHLDGAHRIEDGDQKPRTSKWAAYEHSLVLLGATAVHSILEALVVGFEDEAYGVWILFATIASHKGVTALALGSRFQKAGATIRESIAFAGLFALTAPVSILIGTTIEDVPNLVNLIFTSLSTGTFLYVGAYEVISEEFHDHYKHLDPNSANRDAAAKKTRYLKFAAIFIGMVSMALAALIPHHHAGDHDHDH